MEGGCVSVMKNDSIEVECGRNLVDLWCKCLDV